MADPAAQASPATQEQYRRSIRVVRRAWGDLRADALRPSHVQALMEAMAGTPGKANNVLDALRAMCRWAMGPRELLSRDPTTGRRAIRGRRGAQALDAGAARHRGRQLHRDAPPSLRARPLHRAARQRRGAARFHRHRRRRLRATSEEDRGAAVVPDLPRTRSRDGDVGEAAGAVPVAGQRQAVHARTSCGRCSTRRERITRSSRVRSGTGCGRTP